MEEEPGAAGEGPLDSGADESVNSDPEYLFGDVTSDEAAERFGYLRNLPEQLRGLEARVGESVSPLMEQLQSLQQNVGSQPVFDPKLEKVQSVLKDYDPNLAETLLPALIEDLKGSLNITPLGAEAIQPHVNPMLENAQQTMVEQLVPLLASSLPFDPNELVNRDPTNPDQIREPQTALQKDFATWWEQTDMPTQNALASIGIPYLKALQQFGKWRAERMKGQGQAAGAASARLSSATQPSTAGRRESPSNELLTEEDGYKYYLQKQQRS